MLEQNKKHFFTNAFNRSAVPHSNTYPSKTFHLMFKLRKPCILSHQRYHLGSEMHKKISVCENYFHKNQTYLPLNQVTVRMLLQNAFLMLPPLTHSRNTLITIPFFQWYHKLCWFLLKFYTSALAPKII